MEVSVSTVTNLRRAAALAAGLLGACSFSADYSGTHYSCDPSAPLCPAGQTCSRHGVCEGPDGSHTHDPPDAHGVESMPTPDASLETMHLSFGERPDADVRHVTADTFVVLTDPTSNFGGSDAASFDADPIQNALLRFDLTAAPPGAQVDGAELVLDIVDPLEDGECVIAPLTEAWSEYDASYALRTATLPWTTPGGTVGELVQVFDATTTGEYTVSLPVALVQGWLDAPAINQGIRFASTSPDGRGGQWTTSDSDAAEQRPLLRLTLRAP